MTDRHDQKKATMAANLESKTGRNVSAWAQLVDQSDVDGFNNIVSWLKEQHGLGHFQARLIAEAHRDG